MGYKIKKEKLAFILALALLVLPMLNAVELNNTLLQTSSSNLSINVTTPSIFFGAVSVTSNAINFTYLRNSSTATEYLSFNMTESNKNYTGADLPKFTSSTGTTKVLTSNITAVNADIVVTTSLTCANVGQIIYTPFNGTTTTLNGKDARAYCFSSVISLPTLLVGRGNNTITINNNAAQTDTCNGFFDAGVSFNQFIVILIIVSVGGIILLFMKSDAETDTGELVFIAGMIIVGAIVMVIGMIIINTMAGC